MSSEKEGLINQLKILTEKLNTLRAKHAIEVGASAKFQLEKEIADCEKEIQELKAKLDSIKEDKLGFGLSPLSSSHFFNRKIPHRRLGEISCDRHLEMSCLKNHFFEHQAQSFQHFFICSQIEDMADSLIERFIKSTLAPFNIDYPSAIDANGYAPVLKAQSFPLSAGLERSKQAFYRYFEERLGQRVLSPTSIGDFFVGDLPIMQKDYFIAVFKVGKEHQHHFFPAFLKWAIQDFCQIQQENLKFLFFFHFVAEQSKAGWFSKILGKQKKGIEHLLANLQESSPHCYYLSNLSWVLTQDLKDWFYEHSSKTWEAEQYIEQAKKQYARYGHYDAGNDAFRMHVIEAFLGDIIEQKLKPAF